MAAQVPPEMEEMQKQMQNIQNKVEKKLRPLLRDQFLCMADVLSDSYSEQEALQKQLGGCGQKVQNVQQELDRAMQHFGSSMQQEMMNCQNQAQQAMQAGSSESAAQSAFMQCAQGVAQRQLSNLPTLSMEIDRVINHL